MRTKILLVLAMVCLGTGTALADRIKDDVFKGKLFAPDIILEHQTELDITKQQFTGIRQAVVEVQSGIAEHEWDMRDADQAQKSADCRANHLSRIGGGETIIEATGQEA